MRIEVIGGGPSGLYFSLLMKQAYPETEITVSERNGRDDTFGWGVVFSDETLGNIEAADPKSMERIRESFAYWSDIETFVRGKKVVSTGHGFCGLSRRRLLNILQERCEEVGVNLRFHQEIAVDALPEADLILVADGVNSAIRSHFAEHFGPHIDWRACRFAWLGTTKPLSAFTFVFKENEHGLFQVHAYPFQDGLSTWIVECHEDTWRRAGLDLATEEQTVAYCEALFKEELDGHPLLTNRSLWRSFPTVTNERWHYRNMILMGDAAHTAHFSIGSGTKLAMEDAIALVDGFRQHPGAPLEKVVEAYLEARWVEVAKTQKAAQTSLEWFENSARYMDQPPAQFNFNLMSRSKRITYENLKLRDPKAVADAAEQFRIDAGAELASDGTTPPPMFVPFALRDLVLPNRIVVSPMCQYMAKNGTVSDWHLVHLGSRAIGGAGLVITEMTNVTADGRITEGCAGLYDDAHTAAWSRIVRFVKEHSHARIGIQLAHAGRKGSTVHPWSGRDAPLVKGGWTTLGPSAIPFTAGWPAPKAMDRADMDRITNAFVSATERARDAGFDLIELHMAHGYLLSSFLSPLSNQRTDDYGGSLENRMRYPLEVYAAVRASWPDDRPLAVRLSATDWMDPEGFTAAESVVVARALKDLGCDVIDVSTAGNSPASRPVVGRMYQVPFAERIRYEADIPVMAVGAIQGADHANTILAAGRADLCCLARPHLYDPYLTLHAAEELGYPDQYWPGPYLPGRHRPKSAR